MRTALATLLAILLLLVQPLARTIDSVQPLRIAFTHKTFCTAFSINERDGFWQTAAHCVIAAAEQGFEFTVGMEETQPVYVDTQADVAVLQSKLHTKGFELYQGEIQAGGSTKTGTPIVVLGFPYGLPSLVTTRGWVAVHNVTIGSWGLTDILDVTIAGGNSGSPVLTEGKVAGMIVAGFINSPHAVGVTRDTISRLVGSFYSLR